MTVVEKIRVGAATRKETSQIEETLVVVPASDRCGALGRKIVMYLGRIFCSVLSGIFI